jgi:hypothetical protein
MAFVDYESLTNKYPADVMSSNIQALKEFDLFHCLLAGGASRANAVKKRIPDLPEDFLDWLEVCDGGLLFDTAILTTKAHDAELDLDFETYNVYCHADLREDLELSADWFVFAVAIHADVFFFDMAKKDGCVYQWDVEERQIYAEWPTFENWLTDQINEAIGLIADEKIAPLGVKMEVGGDE